MVDWSGALSVLTPYNYANCYMSFINSLLTISCVLSLKVVLLCFVFKIVILPYQAMNKIFLFLICNCMQKLLKSQNKCGDRTESRYPVCMLIPSQIIYLPSSMKRKRNRSDSVVWRIPQHQRKIKRQNDNTNRPLKYSIKQQLQTDLRRSFGETTSPLCCG